MALQAAARGVAAQDEEIRRLFPAAPTGYVTDVTGTLDPQSVSRLDSLLERLRAATRAEIAVVVLPTIGDRAAVDVAVAIGRAWGVGARAAPGDPSRNAGLVILLVPRRPEDPNSGQIFLAVGQGLEGIVTDLQAGRVRDLMRPYFSSSDYAGGLTAGVGALTALIAKGLGVSDSVLTAADRLGSGAEPDGGNGQTVQTIIIIIFVVLVLLSRLSAGSRRGGRGGGWWGGGFGGGGFGGGGFGGFGGGGGGGGFGGFGGGGGFSGGGAGGRF